MNKIDSFRGENYYLSNFYERPVTYDGITYKNNEAAFQAQKCISYEDRKQFSDLNASEAKHLGRKVSLRPDWESIKVDDMEYAFTVKGGGWGYIHKLFIIYKDGTVIMAREFDDFNILDYTEAFRFNYKNSGVDEDNVAISICNRKKIYLSSILNGKEPNFEEHSNVHFVCDAPTYTMYKITNGTVRELFSTEDVDSCKAMNYIETLCSVLRG